jgi:hypothetical protein
MQDSEPLRGLFGLPLTDWRHILMVVVAGLGLVFTAIAGLRKLKRFRNKPDLDLKTWLNQNQSDCPILQVEVINHSEFEVSISRVGLCKQDRRWRNWFRLRPSEIDACKWQIKGVDTTLHRLKNGESVSIQIPWHSYRNSPTFPSTMQYVYVGTPTEYQLYKWCPETLIDFAAVTAQAVVEEVKRYQMRTELMTSEKERNRRREEARKRLNLSDMAMDLLALAYKSDGYFFNLVKPTVTRPQGPSAPNYLMVGGRPLYNPAEPQLAGRWIAAADELKAAGLVNESHHPGEYKLSGQGVKLAGEIEG